MLVFLPCLVREQKSLTSENLTASRHVEHRYCPKHEKHVRIVYLANVTTLSRTENVSVVTCMSLLEKQDVFCSVLLI